MKSASLVRRGLTEEQVDAALGDLDRADPDLLDARTVAALRLADLLTGDHPVMDAATTAEARRHFTDGELLELATALSVASGWQRFIEAFGIRPDFWSEATPLAWDDTPVGD